MRIEINMSKKTAQHIRSPHTFYDCCGEVEEVMLKVQKEIDKRSEKKIKVPKKASFKTKDGGKIVFTSRR